MYPISGIPHDQKTKLCFCLNGLKASEALLNSTGTRAHSAAHAGPMVAPRIVARGTVVGDDRVIRLGFAHVQGKTVFFEGFKLNSSLAS
jgi:hypothetical protein